MKSKLAILVAVAALSFMGGFGVQAAAPREAAAWDQLYFYDSVPAGWRKWALNPGGSLQYANRDYGRVFHSGYFSHTFRLYSNGNDLHTSASFGNPLVQSGWAPVYGIEAISCWNRSASSATVAACHSENF
ncbi:MAG: hypothetical protein JWM90_1563 [Thermoleophilia bacterium]|nr:hypothetical protein [Thermoleophilia bacterium]